MKNRKIKTTLMLKRCSCAISAAVMFTSALPVSMLTTKVYASSWYADEIYTEEVYAEEADTDSIYSVVAYDDTEAAVTSDYETDIAKEDITVYGYEELPEYESTLDKYGDVLTGYKEITIDGVLFSYGITEKGAAEVCLIDTEAKEVVFPQTIEGHKVVYISGYGRNDRTYTNLKKVTIPEGAECITGSAFLNCINLETVILPDTITQINNHAFDNTYSLKNINWPKNLKVIGQYAFCESGIESAVLPEGLLLIDNAAFKAGNNAYSEVEAIPDDYAYLKELVIPDTVKIIGDSAFYGQGRLSSEISMPSSLKEIGSAAFKGTKVTGDIVFPSTITKIPSNIFAMSNIRSVVVPDTVTYIGDSAFNLCRKLTSVSLPDGYIFFDTSVAGDNELFRLCENLSITIPAGAEFADDNPRTLFFGVKSVKFAEGHTAYASDDCYIYNKDKTMIYGVYDWKRTEYSFIDSVKTIGDSAFENTKYLKKMTISNTVTKIGDWAFVGSAVEELVLPDSVTGIGNGMCSGCSNLKKVTLPKNITELPDGAFTRTAIEEITIPGSVINIGDSAFLGCPLKEIKIPDSVISIGYTAFSDCKELKNVVLSKNIETIGIQAFARCESLKNIELPDGLKTIGKEAFYLCGIKAVEIPESVESIGLWAFKYGDEKNGLPSVILNDSLKEMNSSYPLSGDKIIIPTGVEKISFGSFDNARASQVILPGNINKSSLTGIYAYFPADMKDIWIENTEMEFDRNICYGDNVYNIYGYAGSAAWQMAQNQGLNFHEVSKKDCGNGTSVTYADSEFEESVTPKVESINSKSAEYGKLAAMTGTDFAAYKVSFNGQSGELTPNAMVKVTVPLPDSYDISKCYAYVVNADGELEMVQMDKTDGVFSFWANYGGTFVITQSRVRSMEYNIYYEVTFRDSYDGNGYNDIITEKVLVKEGEAVKTPDWSRQCLALSWQCATIMENFDLNCVTESATIDAVWTEAHEWDTEYTIDREATSDAQGQKSIHCSVHKDVIKPDSTVYIPAKFKGVGIGEDGNVYYYNNGVIDYSYTGFAEDSSGKKYWFDGGIAAKDKQVYDPATDNWYWFDADGTMAVSKDVYVPESNENRENGKWVRYDENGHMVKGEDYRYGNWYRFDEITGEMIKGFCTVWDGEKSKIYCYNGVTGQMEHGAVTINGTEYAFDDVTGVAVDNAWYTIDGNEYWYEKGVRQGLEGRGKEIYDPATDAWYWLDSIDNGKKAVSKDVYQESSGGKWVRYDSNGHMIKGWQYENGNAWYFDVITGSMLKGWNCINEEWYYFDEVTGTLV